MPALTDGFSTLIEFAADTDAVFYEKEVQPPGVEGSGGHDTSTMRHTKWRTMYPGNLVTLTEFSLTVAYDPAVYDDIVDNLIQVNTAITITFSNGGTLVFYGWLESFIPDNAVEGEQPTATITVIPSNTHSTTFAETAPVYTPPA